MTKARTTTAGDASPPAATAGFDKPLELATPHTTTRVQWFRQGREALALSPGLVTCAEPDSFRSRGVRWTFGDVVVSDTVQTPCTIQPTHDDSSGDADYVTALFVMSGGYFINDGNRSFFLGKGAAGWMPGWTRIAAENLHTTRLVRVSVPRAALDGADRPYGPFGLFEGPLMLTSPALSFVLELMHATDERSLRQSRSPAAAQGQGHPTAAVLTQLVAGLFIEQAAHRTGSGDLASGLWVKAMAVIDREFTDPKLDPGSLARRLHVSLRHLQRTFSQNGSTISDAIRERRAAAVVATMTAGTSPYLSLGEVALMNGFSSIKEMRHALRCTHGVTPREIRSAALAAAG